MEYPLDPLEKLVSELIDLLRKPVGTPITAGVNELLKAINRESGFIQNNLIKQVFQISKAKEIERFIQNYQAALTSLLDRLYREDIILPARPAKVREAYDVFYKSILTLLTFIEERFSKYFDTQEKVPDVYLVLTASEIRLEENIIFNKTDISTGDRAALDLVITRYKRFFNTTVLKNISYAEVIYCKMLLKELEELTEVQEVQSNVNLFTALEQILIYTNYNDKEFVQYMVERMAVSIAEPEDLKDQIGLVLQFSKDLHQLPVKPETALLPTHPSINEQLSEWLSEELYFLERRMGMFAISGTRSTISEKKSLIECRVPVDQIGIFFRAASDTKLLTTPSQKKLFEQIAPYLSTHRREKLSADSMRSKSYSPERKDIQGVKDFLMVIYNQVGKY